MSSISSKNQIYLANLKHFAFVFKEIQFELIVINTQVGLYPNIDVIGYSEYYLVFTKQGVYMWQGPSTSKIHQATHKILASDNESALLTIVLKRIRIVNFFKTK